MMNNEIAVAYKIKNDEKEIIPVIEGLWDA